MVSAHLAAGGKKVPNDSRFGSGDVAGIRHYIKLGPLGRAFAAEERHVLLIDEVDKADLEFPNDLLLELDEMRFKIIETQRGDRRQAPPGGADYIEQREGAARRLPAALHLLLHRFPDVPLMRGIIDVHHPHLDAKLLDQACPA